MNQAYRLPQYITCRYQLVPTAHQIRLVRQHSKQIIFQCKFKDRAIVYIKMVDMTHMQLQNCNQVQSQIQLCLKNFMYTGQSSQNNRSFSDKTPQHVVMHKLQPKIINQCYQMNIQQLQQSILDIAIIKLQTFPQLQIYQQTISQFLFDYDGILYFNNCIYTKQCEIHCNQYLRKQRSKIHSINLQSPTKEIQGQNSNQRKWVEGQLLRIRTEMENLLYFGIIIQPLLTENVFYIVQRKYNSEQDNNKVIYPGSMHSIGTSSKNTSINNATSWKPFIKRNIHHKIITIDTEYHHNTIQNEKINRQKILQKIDNAYKNIKVVIQLLKDQINTQKISKQVNKIKMIQNAIENDVEQVYSSSPYRIKNSYLLRCNANYRYGDKIFTDVMKILKIPRFYAFAISKKTVNSHTNLQPMLNIWMSRSQLQMEQNKSWAIEKLEQLQRQQNTQYNSFMLKRKIQRCPYQQLLILKKHFMEGTSKSQIIDRLCTKRSQNIGQKDTEYLGIGWGQLLFGTYRNSNRNQFIEKLQYLISVYRKYQQVPKLRLRYHFFEAKLSQAKYNFQQAINQLKIILRLGQYSQILIPQKQICVLYHEISRLYSKISCLNSANNYIQQVIEYGDKSLQIKNRIYGIYSLKNLSTLYNLIYFCIYWLSAPQTLSTNTRLPKQYIENKLRQDYLKNLIRIKDENQNVQKYDRWIKNNDNYAILNVINTIQNSRWLRQMDSSMLVSDDKRIRIQNYRKIIEQLLNNNRNNNRNRNNNNDRNRNNNNNNNNNDINKISQINQIYYHRIPQNSAVNMNVDSQQSQNDQNNKIEQINNKTQNILILKQYYNYINSNKQQDNSQNKQILSTIKLTYRNQIRYQFLLANQLINNRNISQGINKLKYLLQSISLNQTKYSQLQSIQYYIRDHLFQIYKHIAYKQQYDELVDWYWILQYYENKYSNQYQYQYHLLNEQIIQFMALSIRFNHNYQYVSIMLSKMLQSMQVKQYLKYIECIKCQKNKQMTKQDYKICTDFKESRSDLDIIQESGQSQSRQHKNSGKYILSNNKDKSNNLTVNQLNSVAFVIYLQALCLYKNHNYSQVTSMIQYILDGYQLNLIGNNQSQSNYKFVLQNKIVSILNQHKHNKIQLIQVINLLMRSQYQAKKYTQFMKLYQQKHNNDDYKIDDRQYEAKMLIQCAYELHKQQYVYTKSYKFNTNDDQLNQFEKDTIVVNKQLKYWAKHYKQNLQNCQYNNRLQIIKLCLYAHIAIDQNQFIRLLADGFYGILTNKLSMQCIQSINQIIFKQLIQIYYSKCVNQQQKYNMELFEQLANTLFRILSVVQQQQIEVQIKSNYYRLIGLYLDPIVQFMHDLINFRQKYNISTHNMDIMTKYEVLFDICCQIKGNQTKQSDQLLYLLQQQLIYQSQQQYKQQIIVCCFLIDLSIFRNRHLIDLSIFRNRHLIDLSIFRNRHSIYKFSNKNQKSILLSNTHHHQHICHIVLKEITLPKTLIKIDQFLKGRLAAIVSQLNKNRKDLQNLYKNYQKQTNKYTQILQNYEHQLNVQFFDHLIQQLSTIKTNYRFIMPQSIYQQILQPQLLKLEAQIQNYV